MIYKALAIMVAVLVAFTLKINIISAILSLLSEVEDCNLVKIERESDAYIIMKKECEVFNHFRDKFLGKLLATHARMRHRIGQTRVEARW